MYSALGAHDKDPFSYVNGRAPDEPRPAVARSRHFRAIRFGISTRRPAPPSAHPAQPAPAEAGSVRGCGAAREACEQLVRRCRCATRTLPQRASRTPRRVPVPRAPRPPPPRCHTRARRTRRSSSRLRCRRPCSYLNGQSDVADAAWGLLSRAVGERAVSDDDGVPTARGARLSPTKCGDARPARAFSWSFYVLPGRRRNRGWNG